MTTEMTDPTEAVDEPAETTDELAEPAEALEAEEADAADEAEATESEATDAEETDDAADEPMTAEAATDESPDVEAVATGAADEAEEAEEIEVPAAAAADEAGTAESAGTEEARQAARLSREAPQPEDPDAAERTTKQWYVIHTYSGYENKVKTNLEHRIESMGVEDQIYQVLVPMEEEIEIRNGQRQTVNKKVFPGYVLVEMIMTDESWYVVRNTPGVTSFVGSGNRPTALREGEVKAILKQMGVEAPKFKVQFQKGQSVRVTDGPFAEFIGTVDEVHPERNKVRVLVSIFGRETPVELDFLQIEKL
jgi:transcriptional antiterminator NusG